MTNETSDSTIKKTPIESNQPPIININPDKPFIEEIARNALSISGGFILRDIFGGLWRNTMGRFFERASEKSARTLAKLQNEASKEFKKNAELKEKSTKYPDDEELKKKYAISLGKLQNSQKMIALLVRGAPIDRAEVASTIA